jgi:hypothetical protein
MSARRERGGDDEDDAVTTWKTETRGLRNLPRRLLYTVADLSQSLWWSTFVIVPSALLTVGVVVGNETIYFYAMFCAAMMLALWQLSGRFVGATVELDGGAGELSVTSSHGGHSVTTSFGNPTPLRSNYEETVSLDGVETAQFLSLADRTLVQLHHEKRFANRTSVPVPAEEKQRFRRVLQQYDVSSSEETATPRWAWTRLGVTTLLIWVIPIAGIFVWPIANFWGIFLVHLIGGVSLLRRGW